MSGFIDGVVARRPSCAGGRACAPLLFERRLRAGHSLGQMRFGVGWFFVFRLVRRAVFIVIVQMHRHGELQIVCQRSGPVTRQVRPVACLRWGRTPRSHRPYCYIRRFHRSLTPGVRSTAGLGNSRCALGLRDGTRSRERLMRAPGNNFPFVNCVTLESDLLKAVSAPRLDVKVPRSC